MKTLIKGNDLSLQVTQQSPSCNSPSNPPLSAPLITSSQNQVKSKRRFPISLFHPPHPAPHSARHPDSKNRAGLLWALPSKVNQLLFGVGASLLFFLTATSGLLVLVEDKRFSIPIGVSAGVADGLTSGILTSRGTHQIFTRRPDIWALTPFVFVTLGGIAGLPFMAAVLQAADEISEKTGIDIKIFKPFLGNLALLVYGTLASIGIVNLAGEFFAYFKWKYSKNLRYKFYLMRQYLDDQRSVEEYKLYVQDPESFLKHKFSKLNTILLLFSFIVAFGFSYGIAGEIPQALDSKKQVALTKVLNLFGLIPINEFSKTEFGSKLVSCITGVPLYSMFIGTTLRALPRDMQFLFRSCRSKQPSSVAKEIIYLLFCCMTCLTATFEAIKGGDAAWLILITFSGVFLLNYSGSRRLIYNQFYPLCAHLFARCRKEERPENREEAGNVLSNPLVPSNARNSEALPPITLEDREKVSALQKLSQLQSSL